MIKKSTEEQTKGSQYLRAFKSAIAAAFGVQTKTNHEQDFHQKSIVPYLVAGILLTLVFILSLVGVAKLAAQ